MFTVRCQWKTLAGLLVLIGLGALPAQAAPNIVHQPPLEAKAGQPVPINAMVTDAAAPVVQVRMYYRSGGTLGYQFQLLTGAGYNYGGLIPKEAVTAAGVDYYLEARNQKGEVSTSPLLNAAGAPYHLVSREAAGAPTLRLLLPEDGSALTPDEATVAVVAMDAGASRPELSSLSVVFDGRDVTAQCRVSETLVTFTLPEKLSAGAHSLRVKLRNLDGAEALSPAWSFTLRPAGAPVPGPAAPAICSPS